ncbi:MAG TPA: hypothetical protein VN816_09320 [Acidimicrobiales bacterium]|nr:hypothetical protein [Acidimicrobiales bacterium]
MHPDLIRALARERHAEILRAQHFRDIAAPSGDAGRRGPVHHLRRSLGSALVAAGTRLMPSNPPAARWAVQASRQGTRR